MISNLEVCLNRFEGCLGKLSSCAPDTDISIGV